MEQAIIHSLKPGTLEAYEAVAREKGRSLEAELRAVIEANAPLRRKDSAELLRLCDEALAMTPPDGPDPASDSTLLIRWDRDTHLGRWLDDGWGERDAGR